MYPLIHLFGFLLPTWHFMFFLGAVGAYIWAYFFLIRLKSGTYVKDLPLVFSVCYLFGLFGARFLSVFVDQFDLKGFSDHFFALFSMGPMTFYGGAIGAFVAGYTVICIKKMPFAPISNALLGAGLVGLALGRLGCFFNGDDYGAPVRQGGILGFGGIVIPVLDDGLARYPVQLMESVWSLGLLVMLTFYPHFFALKTRFRSAWGRAIFPVPTQGTDFWAHEAYGLILMGLSALGRFFLEFLRGDPRGTFFFTGLSTSQGIALVIVFCALWRGVILHLSPKP